MEDIFSDVDAGKWYVEAIQFVYDRGLMVGTGGGVFGTGRNVQREEFVQILYSKAGKPDVSEHTPNPFSDVASTPGYPRDAILWAYHNGIAAGNADGTFGVGKPIQRQAVAVMLYKYAQKFQHNFDLTVNDNALDGFSDKNKVENWALPAMKWAVTQGIISGKSAAILDPGGNATRAECAAMIRRLIEKNTGIPNVGDVILFGRYEQDGQSENGKEAIEWKVLKVEKNRALVISKYILNYQPYNLETYEVTWETCSLRKWMNNDFKNAAFTSNELKKIPTVTVVNDDNPTDGTPGGNDTKDKIFCLSTTEVENLFVCNYWEREHELGYFQSLMAESTPYSVAQGTKIEFMDEELYHWQYEGYGYTQDVINKWYGWWWLRSPGGMNNCNACFVSSYGLAGPNHYGVLIDNFDEGGIGVRPAMWISFEK